MKLITLLTISLLLSLTLSTSFLKESKRAETQGGVVIYRNDFYNICWVTSNFYNIITSNDSCNSITVDTTERINCSQAAADKLTQEVFEFKSGVLVKDAPGLPIEAKYSIMHAASCKNKKSELEAKYGFDFLSANSIRIRVVNSFIATPEAKYQFYEQGENVLSFAPLGHKMELAFAINELNLSQKLLKKSLSAGSPNPNNISPEEIELNNGDLKIEKVGLFVEKVVADIYHQVVYICAKGANFAYHFIADRSARDFTHEKGSIGKAITNLISNKMFKTLIRFAYVNRSADCIDASQTPDNKKFSPGLKLFNIGPDTTFTELDTYQAKTVRTERYVPKPSVNTAALADRTSLKKFFTAIQRYALRYDYYVPHNNCQHFATGFYNYLSGKSLPWINYDYMKNLPVSKKKFERFFGAESDAEYAAHLALSKEEKKKTAAASKLAPTIKPK